MRPYLVILRMSFQSGTSLQEGKNRSGVVIELLTNSSPKCLVSLVWNIPQNSLHAIVRFQIFMSINGEWLVGYDLGKLSWTICDHRLYTAGSFVTATETIWFLLLHFAFKECLILTLLARFFQKFSLLFVIIVLKTCNASGGYSWIIINVNQVHV